MEREKARGGRAMQSRARAWANVRSKPGNIGGTAASTLEPSELADCPTFVVLLHVSHKMLPFPFSKFMSQQPSPPLNLASIDLSHRMLGLKGLIRSARTDLLKLRWSSRAPRVPKPRVKYLKPYRSIRFTQRVMWCFSFISTALLLSHTTSTLAFFLFLKLFNRFLSLVKSLCAFCFFCLKVFPWPFVWPASSLGSFFSSNVSAT